LSLHANRATMSLLNMTREMFRKNIEISRITKTYALLLMSGLSKHDLSPLVIEQCLHTQQADGGFVGNTDTIWNIKLLEYFPEFRTERDAAIRWLITDNGCRGRLWSQQAGHAPDTGDWASLVHAARTGGRANLELVGSRLGYRNKIPCTIQGCFHAACFPGLQLSPSPTLSSGRNGRLAALATAEQRRICALERSPSGPKRLLHGSGHAGTDDHRKRRIS